jgi:hypothetical protein
MARYRVQFLPSFLLSRYEWNSGIQKTTMSWTRGYSGDNQQYTRLGTWQDDVTLVLRAVKAGDEWHRLKIRSRFHGASFQHDD